MTKFYYTYVLKSRRDYKLYIGWTIDLKNRFLQHNQGKVKSTEHRLPFDLIYYEACLDKDSAIKREKSLKSGFGRRYLKDRLNL